MHSATADRMNLTQDLRAFLEEICLTTEAIDLKALKEPGYATPGTRACLADLVFHLLHPKEIQSGSTSLKVRSIWHGSLGIERNSDLSWAVWVRACSASRKRCLVGGFSRRPRGSFIP